MKKHDARIKRKVHIRKKISGSSERPRLVVYRSNLHIYAQLVDDTAGKTLAATSTLSLDKSAGVIRPNLEGAARWGRKLLVLPRKKLSLLWFLTATAIFTMAELRLWLMVLAKADWNFKGESNGTK